MPGDLWLRDRKPGDLTLRRDRLTGTDLFLQRRAPGDLRLRRPPEREASLHAELPPLSSQLDAEVTGLSSAELHAWLPALQSQIQAAYARRAELHAAMPSLVSQLDAAYDNAVWRGIESPATEHMQPTAQRLAAACAVWLDSRRVRSQADPFWQAARGRNRPVCAPQASMQPRHRAIDARHQTAVPRGRQACPDWRALSPRIRPGLRAPWRTAIPALDGTCAGFVNLSRRARPRLCAPYQTAILRFHTWRDDYSEARRHRLPVCGHWLPGVLRYGWGGAIVIHVPPPPPDPCRPVGRADLLLRLDRTAELVLRGCRILAGADGTPKPGRVFFIPIARVYIVANNVHLIRAADSLELPCFAMSLAIDVDSWGWRFSAELPADQLANVEPGAEPVEVEAQINTYAWRFLVEDIRRSRSFGKSRIQVSGRGLAARLAAPYSPRVDRANTIDRNATQILDDLLTDNGVPIGWTIDWQLTDWLVQAGAWNHSGTYMDGVKRVAEAAGAIIQADRTAQTLHLLHRYPVAPWDWPTAATAYSIPEAVVVTEQIEWREKPPYNAVYVSGETLGIVGHVVRSGTAGDLVAPMVTHPLITAQEAARQLGIAILADTGRQAFYTLSLPIDPSGIGLGLLEPCQLIEYGPAAVRGLVRATRVEAKGAGVRQIVTLETRP